MPGLDGLRALAVAAVIAYHLGLAWAPGGLLGVGVFFTLSGYLITDLLLTSWESVGNLQLRVFWARRARRLLPALFVMLVGVSTWVAVADPSQLGALRGNVVAAVFYVSNWWLAFQHVSYFARFGPPSPLGHLWSLAVEEQFYLIWPWMLWLGLIWVSRRRRRERAERRAQVDHAKVVEAAPEAGVGPGTGAPSAIRPADLRSLGYLLSGRAAMGEVAVERGRLTDVAGLRLGVRGTRLSLWPLAVITILLAAASAIEMAVLYHPSFDPSRIYDGTDTRAFALLLGAALAMVWPSMGLRPKLSVGARRMVEAMGVTGLVVIGLLIFYTNQYSPFLYRGGMVVLALATVLVVASASHPASRLGPVLGCRPLRWAGVRSYAIYLWHYPVIVLTTPTVTEGTDLTRAALQVAATLVLAELSWQLVETPVRHGALGRIWEQLRSPRAGVLAPAPSHLLALCTVPLALLLTGLALAGLMPTAPAGTLAVDTAPTSPFATLPTSPPTTTTTATAAPTTGAPVTAPPTTATAATTTTTTTRPSSTTRTSAGATTSTTATKATTRPTTSTTAVRPTTTVGAAGGAALKTSCQEVVQIGDSTSESLVSANYLPDAAQRLPAQYIRVGIKHSIMRIEGGTSVVETVSSGEQNAYEMAQALVHQGYKGCWVVALGTNDSADVYVGSNVSFATRIKRMMSVIGHDPVLWVNVKSLLSSGPYAEANMERWDQALLAACPSYPDMRVLDWAALVKAAWFTPDGIHYNSPGSAPRAAAFADGLATAFPAHPGSRSSDCVVTASPSWHLPAYHF